MTSSPDAALAKPGSPRHPALSRIRTNTGPRFALVCGLVLLVMALTMALPEGDVQGSVTTIVAGLALIAAVWASRVSGRFFRLITVVVAVTVIGSVVWLLLGENAPTTGDSIVALLLVTGIPIAILAGIRDERTVNVQTVFAAVSLYLLLGLFFAFLISAVGHASSAPYFAQGTDGTLSERVYFSFVTLATLGYGDYTPAGNLGHALAVLEALIGQLYLVTVVAVVVTRLGRPGRKMLAHEKESEIDGPQT